MTLKHILLGLALSASVSSCSGWLYDDEGDCAPKYRVEFSYDHNMKFADAYGHEVRSVTVYLLDATGKVAWTGTTDTNAMAVDVAPGQYTLLAWAKGEETDHSWQLNDKLGQTLVCRHDGTLPYRDTDIDRLYHAQTAPVDFPATEGTFTYKVNLHKDVNNIRVMLQHIAGEPIDVNRYEFTVTAPNSALASDNNVCEDENIVYRAWRTATAVAGLDPNEPSRTAGFGLEANQIQSRTAWSGALAELTTSRLIKGHDVRLEVRVKDNPEPIISIPFIDYALLIKGFYNRDMDDQEYLDRQDEYSMTFFLDEDLEWISVSILVNSWRVVIQETEIN